ncbi:Poly(U)-specific endoribonuclease-A, partial [Fasciolopsis buskii]
SPKFRLPPEPNKSHVENLSDLIHELWLLDSAQLTPGIDYKLNLQGKLGRDGQDDRAKDRLFTFVKWSRIRQIPSVPEFLQLLDNYEPIIGVPENMTDEKQIEIDSFLTAVIKTSVMRKTHQFLVDRGLSMPDPNQFKEQLFSLWFRQYKRRRRQDSSAFEHVFVGEQGYNKLLGLHNWIQFADQEGQKKIDYLGYYETCGTPTRFIVVSFRLPSGLVKRKTGFWIGSTPAFEMALYTAIFLATGQLPQIVRFELCEAIVQCHVLQKRKNLATCYPRLIGNEIKFSGRKEDGVD